MFVSPDFSALGNLLPSTVVIYAQASWSPFIWNNIQASWRHFWKSRGGSGATNTGVLRIQFKVISPLCSSIIEFFIFWCIGDPAPRVLTNTNIFWIRGEAFYFDYMLSCQVLSERVQEDQLQLLMLGQEKEELDARLQACKKRRLNELLKRVTAWVREEIKVAVIEKLVEDSMNSWIIPVTWSPFCLCFV